MDINMDRNHFRSKDLSESSFLFASGLRLIKTDNENGTIWFVFENKDKCERLSLDFWSKQANVNAMAYVDALRTLKALIFRKR